MKFSEAIRIRIKELLEINKMNVNQLAIKAGISHTTIRSILSGESLIPSTITIFYICIGFEISISEFYNSKLFSIDNINED